MIKSMTAFARQESHGEAGHLAVELRSVNHRYLESSLRLPEELRPLEPQIRDRLAAGLSRGKIDCNIRFQPAVTGAAQLSLNKELASTLAHLSREVDAFLYDAAPASSMEILRWPGVLQAPAADVEKLQAEALALVDRAVAELNATRAREGEKLKALLEQRLDAMQAQIPLVLARLPEVMGRYRQRLADRLAELKGELDPQRLEQEIVVFATRIDVAEELDRLETHIIEVRRVLKQDQPVGRRLDFLMQELNREANTLGSKSADTETTKAAVELKVLIEQMREQVQNIE
ncbi:MAG TPA: YicC/YloC family endoribonuclease [Geothrix sp.]|nr:YicC/YloC family endoribonuclease [Geothrix sp.]